MITRISVKNFKCLRDVDVELAPFTVFIGPNDSGKSSLLDAISALGKTTGNPLTDVFSGPFDLGNLVWRREATGEVSWKVQGRAGDDSFEYSLAVAPGDTVPRQEQMLFNGRVILQIKKVESGLEVVSTPEGQQVQRANLGFGGNFTGLAILTPRRTAQPLALSLVSSSLLSTTKYKLDTDALRRPSSLETNPVLDTTGSNLVAVLDSIATGPDRSAINELESDLRKAIPSLDGIYLDVVSQQQKALRFTLSNKKPGPVTIPAELASDGAILFTAFLALAYGNTPDLVFIEEPENGLHYSRLDLVIDLLRRMSTGEVGNRPRQVIITTHSPILLNCVQPEEVRVFRRPNNEGTEITPMDKAAKVDDLLKEFSTGELWYLLGEEKLVEGVRG